MEQSLGKGRTQQARCFSLVGKGVLTVGASAPDFKLPNQNSKTRRLSDYREQKASVFLPEGHRPGMHQAGLQLSGSDAAVLGEGGCDPGREPGHRGLAQEVLANPRAALHSAVRPGAESQPCADCAG